MKKISVFLAFIMVFGLFAAVNVSAAGAEPKLVYEPASMTYRPNENVELITAADGSSLNFGWHETISTPEKDYSFDLSTNKGFSDFAAFDPNGKMKAKVNTQTQSNGKTLPDGLYIRVSSKNGEDYNRALGLIHVFDEGDIPVRVRYRDSGAAEQINGVRAEVNTVLIRELKKLLGEDSVVAVKDGRNFIN